MGNTIRREPVSFDIPDSPDYEFLNITDFRGIAVGDNPFILASNTASDMLNLYVDETNTLTTRPRLQKYDSLKESHNNVATFLGFYYLSFGFLINYIDTSNNHKLEICLNTKNNITYYSVSNSNIVSGDKLYVFEQDDNIYVLDGNNYYVITYALSNNKISNASCKLVEGYVPLVYVGGTDLISGASNESFNLLSDKYRENFFWDGTWNPEDLKRSDNDEILNKYRYDSYLDENGYVGYRLLSVGDSAKKDVFDGKALVKSISNNDFLYIVGSNENRELAVPTIIPEHDNLYGDCSKDGSIYAYYYQSNTTSSSSQVYGGIFVKRPSSPEFYNLTEATNAGYGASSSNAIKMSRDGKVIVANMYINNTPTLKIFSFDEVEDKYVVKYEKALDVFPDLGMSDDGNICYYNMSNTETTLIYDLDSVKTKTIKGRILAISPKGNYVLITDNANGLYKDITSENPSFIEFPTQVRNKITQFHDYAFSEEGDKIYYFNYRKSGWILLNDISDAVCVEEFLANFETGNYIVYANSNCFIFGLVSDTITHFSKYCWNYDSQEPLLEVTHEINSDTIDDYSEWSYRKNLFKQSLLSIRFDNERWFGVKNVVFRTANNNPTFIPMSNYASLGETDEDLTGFNLIQDDLLIAYKDNYIWAISPMTYTANDVTYYDYNYQETKNTIGNNAFGASIVSVYSELPLQITYDGIYSLKQLSNVYASDRISESISDNITKKWLLEDKEVIKNAQTLNRLYWTYIILSYEKITKVYLLDNRTNSWFYWELPIKIINAFVKNNKVYVSDNDGIIYTLETSEIINKYNSNTTEYYDEGELLIKWFWKSQILPLGTINYAKRLIDTTFIFTDTDVTDEYSLDYKFTAYRKVVSETNATTISNQLNYIQSTTKKTLINRCNFIQLELSNTEEDFNSNKLRLVGLGFKYVLLEGLL